MPDLKPFKRVKPWKTIVKVPPPPDGEAPSVFMLLKQPKLFEKIIERDRARAQAAAILRFQEEFHCFVAGVGVISSYMPPPVDQWIIILRDVEMQDEKHEGASTDNERRGLAGDPIPPFWEKGKGGLPAPSYKPKHEDE